jgi:hypothetical protein
MIEKPSTRAGGWWAVFSRQAGLERLKPPASSGVLFFRKNPRALPAAESVDRFGVSAPPNNGGVQPQKAAALASFLKGRKGDDRARVPKTRHRVLPDLRKLLCKSTLRPPR